MVARSYWSKEDNYNFKKALISLCAFWPTRFEDISRNLSKPIADVKQHYEQLVDDLLKAGSCQEAYARAQSMSMYHVERPTVWNKDEHEWFLIGVAKFKNDWEKISILLVSKTAMEVAIYAKNFFEWENSTKNAMKRPLIMLDPTVKQENFVSPLMQPKQELIAPELDQPSYS